MDAHRTKVTTREDGTLTITVPANLRARMVDVIVLSADEPSLRWSAATLGNRLRNVPGVPADLPELPLEAFDREDVASR